MFKGKKQLHLFKIVLFMGLGLLFIINNNNQIMAMNNGHASQNNNHTSRGNNHTDDELEQARILQNMNLEQGRIVQQIFNARSNNVSEADISLLWHQHRQITQQINNHHISMFLERQHLLLIQEMDAVRNNTPLYTPEEVINRLRDIQIRIEQNQRQIQQIQNNQNQPERL
ncbi:putative membrane protein, SVM family protein [Candidatus Phytoplasma solani]|uniref:SVM family protein n=1 Tax=Candidatus Phytoplasma solani TaxID=69896 RepID=UPI0032DBB5A8